MNNHLDRLDQDTWEALAAALKPRELGQTQRDSMRTRILARVSAPAPEGTRTIRAEEGEWIPFLPLVEMKLLRQDLENRNQTVLYRLHPGAEFPSHAHTQEEECLVIEGEMLVGDHAVRAGDVHIAAPGHSHPPIRSPLGALILVRSELGAAG